MLIKITTTPLERNATKTQQLYTLIKTAYDCNLFDTKEYFSQLDTLKAVKAGNADALEAIKTKNEKADFQIQMLDKLLNKINQ